MDGPLQPDLLLHLETVDGLDVLDAHRLHVLGPATVDVAIGLLHRSERVVLPEVRVHRDLWEGSHNLWKLVILLGDPLGL